MKAYAKASIVAVIALFVVLMLFMFLPSSVKDLTVVYPFDGTLFPPEIAPPTMKWDDSAAGAVAWTVAISFQGGAESITADTKTPSWKPERNLWETIKTQSLGSKATVTVSGYKTVLGFKKLISRRSFSFSTSNDEVGAPIFFRAVTLPFEYAVNHMETIKWCLGDISSDSPPQVALQNMPVCGNCHSFSADGSTIGMDVDYANDKGSYIVTSVKSDMTLTNNDVITWSDYRKDDGELTFGLLSQISPDSRYAISTVKDRSVFVPVNDLYYSQLFFPLKGILVSYDREKGAYKALKGADDKNYVQSNPAWSPDGKTVVFARSKVGSLDNDTGQVLLTQAQCEKYISRKELFKFDLYSIPFNGGEGGEATPVAGASGNGMSNYFAKYSPDGKWIVFCRASSFMLLQPDSKLYIIPSEGGEAREMTCNTDNMNSWHSWSPNGRWLVFTSKKFTPYTQLFLTHIDENGNDSPPVLLENFTPPDRAANIPEFVNMTPGSAMQMHEEFIDYYSFFNKAGQLSDEGRYQEAEQFYRKSLELKPDYANSHKRLGYLLAQMKRMDEAQKEWESALTLDPKDHLLHLNLGSLYLDEKKYDRARAEFEAAIKYDKKCAPAITGLGLIALTQGNRDAALKHFKSAVETDPSFEEGYCRIGYLLLENGQNKDAEAQFRKAYDLNAKNFEANLGIAHVLERTDGKATEAIQFYRKSISLRPTHVQTYIDLGNLYLKLGDKNHAIEVFEEALRANPRAENVRVFLNQLKSKA